MSSALASSRRGRETELLARYDLERMFADVNASISTVEVSPNRRRWIVAVAFDPAAHGVPDVIGASQARADGLILAA